MWGCTAESLNRHHNHRVFPTHVGVYLLPLLHQRLGTSFPHACGGVPETKMVKETRRTFSPRMWGCTFRERLRPCLRVVFPTHVGVYLLISVIKSKETSFPHACGGVPKDPDYTCGIEMFSPRMWGCTFIWAYSNHSL